MSVMYREPSIIKKSKDGRVAAVDMASELLNSRVLLLEGEVNDVPQRHSRWPLPCRHG